MDNWFKWGSELQAIAQVGLEYTKDPYDDQRFQRIRELSAEIMAHHTQDTLSNIHSIFEKEESYATPKVDVRGAVFKDDKILLVRERQDNLWTLPGGWADVNESPKECVEKEVWEESGFEVCATKLVGMLDKQKHDHPKHWPHTYKLFFLCELLGGEATPSLETSDVEFFPEDKIPDLSLPRVIPSQIALCFEHYRNTVLPTVFD